MSLILDGTNGLSDVDGSAATPAIRGTDTNTGIFFPAADTIAFSEGGVESMRIDSNGNVGIGTSSSVNGLSIYRYGTQWTGNTGNTYPVPAGNVFLQTQIVAGADNWFGTTGSYGATTGSSNLLLQANLNNTSQQAGNYIGSEATGSGLAALTFGRMIGAASTGGNATKSEAMRIDSSGNLLIGTTSNAGTSNGLYCPALNNFTTAAAANTNIQSDGLFRRSTSSLKYKKDVQDSTHGLAEVLQLRPVTYKGKAEADGDKVFGGLIAEEVHEAGLTEFVQYADDGSPDALAYGNMVSLLAKAIQELNAKVEQQAAEIATLKNQPAE